jgi:hypothetical protein
MDVSTAPNGRTGKQKLRAWVATGSENGNVLIWDLQERRVLQIMGQDSTLLPDDERAVVSNGDDVVMKEVRRASDGEPKNKEAVTRVWHRRPIIALAVSAACSLQAEKPVQLTNPIGQS